MSHRRKTPREPIIQASVKILIFPFTAQRTRSYSDHEPHSQSWRWTSRSLVREFTLKCVADEDPAVSVKPIPNLLCTFTTACNPGPDGLHLRSSAWITEGSLWNTLCSFNTLCFQMFLHRGVQNSFRNTSSCYITRSGTESSIQDKTSCFILLDLIKRVNTSLSFQKNKINCWVLIKGTEVKPTSAQKHPQLIIIIDREVNQTNFFQSLPWALISCSQLPVHVTFYRVLWAWLYANESLRDCVMDRHTHENMRNFSKRSGSFSSVGLT